MCGSPARHNSSVKLGVTRMPVDTRQLFRVFSTHVLISTNTPPLLSPIAGPDHNDEWPLQWECVVAGVGDSAVSGVLGSEWVEVCCGTMYVGHLWGLCRLHPLGNQQSMPWDHDMPRSIVNEFRHTVPSVCVLCAPPHLLRYGLRILTARHCQLVATVRSA
ncbi:hypothetical protein LX32DRAFT_51338 [Colletotrichum zoysiae]|uniref:Uncharacterized protein n=1 Tax=Colletotrichum zoysiae TaxID=1216348 RepID=A0AAD9HBC7_9PEZI|nr:hypothetical protein LX32DRAFT_51338 [Colletotrichum zoysiae]